MGCSGIPGTHWGRLGSLGLEGSLLEGSLINPIPKAQNGPKNLYIMIFGPESRKISVLRALEYDPRVILEHGHESKICEESMQVVKAFTRLDPAPRTYVAKLPTLGQPQHCPKQRTNIPKQRV